MIPRLPSAALGLSSVVVLACGSTTAPATDPTSVVPPSATSAAPDAPSSAEEDAQRFLAWFSAAIVPIHTRLEEAYWAASTDVSDRNTGRRMGAESVYAAFVGSSFVIARANAFLSHRIELSPPTIRQLEQMLLDAAETPGTRPDLVARRVELEARQSAILDGFEFCLERRGERCRRPVTTNDLDEILRTSRHLPERLRAWEASKEVGRPLGEGILALRDVRNAVAREMGHADFMALQIADYGMPCDEMMALLDGLVAEMRPLYEQLHCWAKHELARRFGQPVPKRIPAHWIGNRWAQSWPGLVESASLDDLFQSREPAWITKQAERFYVSMGFPELPGTFWERSDLYPVPPGETREKNDHASAWHIDLGHDVRSLMSVVPNAEWFGTAHHELGHVYYFLAYSTDAVPPLLRTGANRAFHEAIGSLIELAAGQPSYLRQIGVLPAERAIDAADWLLADALHEAIVFIPFAAGTMTRFENDLYAGNLAQEELDARWWQHVARYQGVEPPATRPAGGCDACTKTHINDDPGQYFDYALSVVILHQLHEHICREIVHADPHDCNYYGQRAVGDFLSGILRLGATRDWREVLRDAVGEGLSAGSLVRFYAPIRERLERENADRECRWEP